jgi:hypothetical protein
VRVSPRDGKSTIDPIASTFNNPGTRGLGNRPTGVNIWRIDYDTTFPPLGAKPNQPCTNLLNGGLLVGAAATKCANGGTLQENFAVLSPVSREVFARTRHRNEAMLYAAVGGPPVPVTVDILGSPANQGEYTRPLGISLGGLEPPAPIEFNLNVASQPFVFEGLPWLLDRRVGPSGCASTGCEPVATFPIGSLAASTFPSSGANPDDIVTGIAGGLAVVPVPGRPVTYFQSSANGGLDASLLPLPAPAQCTAGAP